ncbi:hypothetical protein ACJBV7_10895, partial [Streptococcus suis]
TDRVRRVSGKTNASWEYHISLLPRVAQTRLLIIHSAPTNDGADLATEKRQQLWARYEGLSMDQKALSEERLTALVLADELAASGL